LMYLWHLLMLPAWAVTAGGWAVARLTAAGARRAFRPKTRVEAVAHDAPAWSRRQVLAAAAVSAPPLLTVGMTGLGLSRLTELRIRELDVALPGLPPALDGLRIAHVTDVHVGRYTRGAQLRRIAEATNRLEADLVLMTGDLLDQSILDLPEALDFVRMIDPRSGLAMCEGNHDLIDDGLAFRERTKAAGVPLLVQEARTLQVRGEPVQLLGLGWSRREDLIRQSVTVIATLREPGAFPILLEIGR